MEQYASQKLLILTDPNQYQSGLKPSHSKIDKEQSGDDLIITLFQTEQLIKIYKTIGHQNHYSIDITNSNGSCFIYSDLTKNDIINLLQSCQLSMSDMELVIQYLG